MKRCKYFLLALVLALLLPLPARAAGYVDTTAAVTLTLDYHDDGAPLVGAAFSIYRVADIDAYGELQVTDDFKSFAVDIDIRGKNDEAWRALASTLEGYVLNSALTSEDSGTTDKSGHLTFPTTEKALRPGLYLVLGERHRQYGNYYDAMPFLILLPAQDGEQNEWVYDLGASPKHTDHPIPDTPTTVTRRVLKVWDDDGAAESRPQSVTVQLLRDGAVYDTVVLSAENGWRWEWTGLDSAYRWTVIELTPEGYRVTITREGITFVVTNTQIPDSPDTPDTPDKPDKPDSPDSPGTPTLPQTGQLWWPVPLLLLSGALLLCAGLRRRKDTRDAA